MKKFSYRMENILQIKQQLEQQQKIDFAIASQKYEEEKEKLIRLTIQQRGYERRARELMTQKLNVRDLKENKRAIDTMKSLIRTQMIAVHQAEKALEKERKKLSEIQIDRKTHEKLKEYAFRDYMKEYDMEESKEIDQIVAYNYSRKEGEA